MYGGLLESILAANMLNFWVSQIVLAYIFKRLNYFLLHWRLFLYQNEESKRFNKCSSPWSPVPLKILTALTSKGPIHRPWTWGQCSSLMWGEVWPRSPGEDPKPSLHAMLISLKYHTADHLNRFCVGVFVFSVSVVCDRIELYKYQTGLWPDCCGWGMYKGKRERHALKLVIFLSLLSVYCILTF